MLHIDGERKGQGWLCLHVERGQSRGQNASSVTYIHIYGNPVPAVQTRLAHSTPQYHTHRMDGNLQHMTEMSLW